MRLKIADLIIFISILFVIYMSGVLISHNLSKPMKTSSSSNSLLSAAAQSRSQTEVIRETLKPQDSNNEEFWLSSGGMYYIQDEYSRTLFGELPRYSKWRILYNSNNPRDTDNGYHPQNLFRLITKEEARDSTEQFYFLIAKDNLSESPNRNETNGVLAISRYQDSNNLYYAGIRVDGTAIIKKKINGIYHTLAQVQIYESDGYDRNSNPSLIPKGQWIGIRANIRNIDSTKVEIDLFIDKEGKGEWKKVLEVVDTYRNGIPPIIESGHGGIRTDFMDVEFKEFNFASISS